ncbi:MAG: nucleotidyltransferase family protein [Mycoplasmatales bacterium]
MNIYGVIVEVYPFNNGHIHFLNEVKKEANGAPIICITSTSFVQRGEPSVLSSSTKVSLLLKNYCDLVLELPYIYANQGAQYFAYNAVKILSELNVTHLCFGSESNELNNLIKHINIKKSAFKDGIHKKLDSLKSNDILGISYLQAIDSINKNITPVLIKRINNEYNDKGLVDNITSATSIRNNIKTIDYKRYMPLESYEGIHEYNQDKVLDLLKLNIEIALDQDINIFLSHKNELLSRIKKYINKVSNIDELLEYCKDNINSKYKYSRIIYNTILLVTEEDGDQSNRELYLRVLGSSAEGTKLIKGNDNYFVSLKDSNLKTTDIQRRAINLYDLLTKQATLKDNFNKKIKML